MSIVRRPLAAATLAFAATATFAPAATAQWVGEDAHDHVFEHAMQGKPLEDLTLDALVGRTVVLEFWATWCGPCLASMPHLAELAETFDGEPIEFILITTEETDLIEAFLAKRELPGNVVIDEDGSVFDAYRVRGIPRTIVIDADGVVALDTHPMSLEEQTLREVVDGTFAFPEPEGPRSREATPEDVAAAEAIDRAKEQETFRYGGFRPGTDPLLDEYLARGLIDPATATWTTTMRRTLDPQAGGGHGSSWGNGAGITMLAGTSLQVLEMAFDVVSERRIVDEAELAADERKWDVIVARPAPHTLDDVRAAARTMATAMLGVEVERVTERRPVLAVDTSSVDGGTVRRRTDVDWENDPTRTSLQPLDGLLARMEDRGDRIVVADAADAFVVDTWNRSPWSMDAEELRFWLESLGIRFEETEREVELLRVRKRDEAAASG